MAEEMLEKVDETLSVNLDSLRQNILAASFQMGPDGKLRFSSSRTARKNVVPNLAPRNPLCRGIRGPICPL